MTVVMGVVDTDVVWLAADKRVNEDHGVLSRVRFDKLHTYTFRSDSVKLMTGWAGDAYLRQLWELWIITMGKELADLRDRDDPWFTVFNIFQEFKGWLLEREQLDTEEGRIVKFMRGDPQILVAYHGCLWSVGSDAEVMESATGYDAIGSGGPYVRGIMEYLWHGKLDAFRDLERHEKVNTIANMMLAAASWMSEVGDGYSIAVCPK